MNTQCTEIGRLIVTPNPVILEDQQNVPVDLREGESLYTFLSRHVNLSEQWEVHVDGVLVLVEDWITFKPHHGQVIEVRGAVGKTVLYLVAIAALTYFTLGAGGIAGGSFLGLTGTAGYVAAAGAYIAGPILGPRVQPR